MNEPEHTDTPWQERTNNNEEGMGTPPHVRAKENREKSREGVRGGGGVEHTRTPAHKRTAASRRDSSKGRKRWKRKRKTKKKRLAFVAPARFPSVEDFYSVNVCRRRSVEAAIERGGVNDTHTHVHVHVHTDTNQRANAGAPTQTHTS